MANNSTAMQLIMSLSVLQTQMLKKVDQQLSVHGISFTEFTVMHHLNNAPNYSMRRIDLAESVGLSASGVTRLLLPMEKINLVEKEVNPRDARVSLVKLSDAGISLFQDALQSFEIGAANATRGLDQDQIVQLHTLLEAVR
ncbi:MarR family winged helix-turn-helix transcriptional regulator [Undibacterium sp. Di24W]|uniref:MarR family winged helix-turn-helix transcriptional regulator n=1 Tax=Undibacterium sp. Di24W TaxID=3413033 RepID=UPI003BF3791C